MSEQPQRPFSAALAPTHTSPDGARTDPGRDWEWPDTVEPALLRRMAEVTRVLFTQPERWVHRRVEKISFKDHRFARQQVSVDFTLPVGVKPVGHFHGQDVYVAPLFLLAKDARKPPRERKRAVGRLRPRGAEAPYERNGLIIPTAPYSHIDLIDDAGRSVPLSTRRQSSLLAETMLLEAAQLVLGAPASAELAERLSAIAYRGWPELRGALAWMLEEPLASPRETAAGQAGASTRRERARLRADDAFPELAYTLASHSIVVCPIADGPRRRTIYKLLYDVDLNESFSASGGWLRRSLRLRSEEYSIPLNEIGAAASYHVEIDVPKDLRIDSASLIGKLYRWFGDGLLDRAHLDYAIQQTTNVSEVKIYVPEPPPGRRAGATWVRLRVPPSVFHIGALTASIVIAAMLTIAAFALPVVAREHQSETAAAALLLVPALVAVYMAREGEHPITTMLLRPARVVLFVNAILPVFAVFLLIATWRREASPARASSDFWLGPLRLGQPSTVWIGLAVVSLLFVATFLCSVFARGSKSETIYRPAPRRWGQLDPAGQPGPEGRLEA